MKYCVYGNQENLEMVRKWGLPSMLITAINSERNKTMA